MRTTGEELAVIGGKIAEKLNAAEGKTVMMLPLKGVSAIGGFFKDAGFAAAVLTTLSDVDREPLLFGACHVRQGQPADTAYPLYRASGETVEDISPYLGIYESQEAGIEAKVGRESDGNLVCHALGMVFDLVFAGGTTFMMIPKGSGLTSGDPVRFLVRGGKAWGVAFKSRIFPRKE